MASELDIATGFIDLVKKLNNTTNIFVGVVKSIELDTRTCTVEQVTGIANNGLEIPDNDENSEYHKFVNNGLLHDNVALLSGGNIDDGILMIPKIGSQVTVMTNARHQCFIIQYSAIDNYNIVPSTDYSIQVNESILKMDEAAIDINIKDGAQLRLDEIFVVNTKDNKVSIQADTDFYIQTEDATFTLSDKLEINTNNGFDIIANNGAEISGNAKISIKNSAETLSGVLNQIALCLTDIATAVCAAPGSPLVAPTLAADIAQLTTKITSLLE